MASKLTDRAAALPVITDLVFSKSVAKGKKENTNRNFLELRSFVSPLAKKATPLVMHSMQLHRKTVLGPRQSQVTGRSRTLPRKVR